MPPNSRSRPKASKEDPMETDELRYRGNQFPRLLRVAWTVFALFMVVYLARYMWPDLKDWMSR
jgi:hypothetical protein